MNGENRYVGLKCDNQGDVFSSASNVALDAQSNMRPSIITWPKFISTIVQRAHSSPAAGDPSRNPGLLPRGSSSAPTRSLMMKPAAVRIRLATRSSMSSSRVSRDRILY